MDCFLISLPEKEELRHRLNNLRDVFGDRFHIWNGVKLTREEWRQHIMNNTISPFYSHGRKDLKGLLGESGAWLAHRILWEHIVSKKIRKAMIVEDGSVFEPDFYHEDKILENNKQILFLNKETGIVNGELKGFGLNCYVITYKSAKRLLELTKSIIIPLDLMVIELCNHNKLTWDKGRTCIAKDRTVIHSTSDELIDQNDDFCSKQDERTLLERFFFNSEEVLNRKKPKIAFCGTYPLLGTGYAKIGYELTKRMADHLDVLYCGFQRGKDIEDRDLDDRIKYFDLAKLAPGSDGNFGFPAIPKILEDEKPDYLMIYNDCLITSHLLDKLKNFKGKKIAYLDLLVPYHDMQKIRYIRDNVDFTFVFTYHYRQHLIDCYGFDANKVGVIPHGMRDMTIHKNPRERFSINKDDFIVLNINRNSHRKRLETTLRAFVEFWEMTEWDKRVKLQLSCNMNQADGLDILNYMNLLCIEYKQDFDFLTKNIMNTTNPTQLPDEIIDNYYQIANVGITTSQGEGWGLFAFEAAYFGLPLVSSDLPTHREFLHDYENVMYCNQVGEHVEHGGLKGIYPLFNYKDFAEKLYDYYWVWQQDKLKNVDGRYMADRYNWDNIAHKFVRDLDKIN